MTSNEDRQRRRALVREALNAEELAAIGEVAVRAAVLDYMVEVTFERIIRDYPQEIRRRALAFSGPQMLEVVIEALQFDMPHHSEKIANYRTDVKTARNRRHDTVHSIWMPAEDGKKALIDPREWKERPRTTTSVSDMQALADQLIDLTFELGDWKTLIAREERSKKDLRVEVPKPPR